jgi:hypothetical protein
MVDRERVERFVVVGFGVCNFNTDDRLEPGFILPTGGKVIPTSDGGELSFVPEE